MSHSMTPDNSFDQLQLYLLLPAMTFYSGGVRDAHVDLRESVLP